jgi:hypothetical protein
VTNEALLPVTPRFARAVLRGRRDLEHCAISDVLEIPASSQHDSPAMAGDVTVPLLPRQLPAAEDERRCEVIEIACVFSFVTVRLRFFVVSPLSSASSVDTSMTTLWTRIALRPRRSPR